MSMLYARGKHCVPKFEIRRCMQAQITQAVSKSFRLWIRKLVVRRDALLLVKATITDYDRTF